MVGILSLPIPPPWFEFQGFILIRTGSKSRVAARPLIGLFSGGVEVYTIWACASLSMFGVGTTFSPRLKGHLKGEATSICGGAKRTMIQMGYDIQCRARRPSAEALKAPRGRKSATNPPGDPVSLCTPCGAHSGSSDLCWYTFLLASLQYAQNGYSHSIKQEQAGVSQN